MTTMINNDAHNNENSKFVQAICAATDKSQVSHENGAPNL